MIVLVTRDGKPLEEGLSIMFKRIVDQLNSKSGDIASDVMTNSVKNWVTQRYPGSKHWDPNKVTKGDSLGTLGTTNIDIPGAARAYTDITIKPVSAKYLTIPIHSSAYGKKVTDFNDLFKPKGKNILAKNEGGQLVAMFALAKSAFQKKDSSLLPPDEHLANGIFKSLISKIQL